MSQSCETLITKINEWQQAILELEKLSEEFLNTSDKSLKTEIENKKQEIVSREKEYQILAYPELPNGEKLFWPEKEMLKEIAERTGWYKDNIKVKGNHLIEIDLSYINLSQFSYDFSLFHNLEKFVAEGCQLKKLSRFSTSVKRIWISDNPGIDIPDDLTYLNNLEVFCANSCQSKKLPYLSTSVKEIEIGNNPDITEEEKQRFKKEHPNVKKTF